MWPKDIPEVKERSLRFPNLQNNNKFHTQILNLEVKYKNLAPLLPLALPATLTNLCAAMISYSFKDLDAF